MQPPLEIGNTTSMVYIPSLDARSDEWFDRVVQANRDRRIERNAKGDLEIMSPTGAESGARNALISARLFLWAEKDGSGRTYDSSTGFQLPNRAIRAPDASWISRSRLTNLSAEEMAGYLPLAPDFVIELRSPSDSLARLRAKMAEYIENGAELGWLIDPISQQVHIYRQGRPVEELESPATVSGDPVLKGFVLDLAEIW